MNNVWKTKMTIFILLLFLGTHTCKHRVSMTKEILCALETTSVNLDKLLY